MPIRLVWETTLRTIIAGYWLFFSSQKWFDHSWVRGLLETAAAGNQVPLYGLMLRTFIVPNWEAFAVVTTILEAAVGIMLMLGLFTRAAATVGAVIDMNLLLSLGFCSCPWANDFLLVFWFYFAPFLLNVQLIFDKSSRTWGLQRYFRKAQTRNSSAR